MATPDLVTVLVEGTFEEQVVEVAAFLSRSKPEAERNDYILPLQKAATEAGEEDATKKGEVVRRLVGEIRGIGEGSQDREIEGVFNLLAALVLQNFAGAEGDAARSELLGKLCEALTKDESSEKSVVRYRILSNIFNQLPATSPSRLAVFTSLLNLASANEELDLLSDALAAAPRWLAEWNVSPAEKASCLLQIASAFERADQGARALEFFLLHLRLLTSTDAAAKEAAERTTAAALRLPRVFEFESLLQVPAVQALKDTPVFELLRVFVAGSFDDWEKWQGTNAAELQRLNLPAAELSHKIRLLDLASLCARSVSKEVPYAEIAKTLKIGEDEVELWVIDVIRAGLVSGKLSQVHQSFRVYRSAFRTFGPDQWRALESRLVQWQSSISAILESIASSRGGSSAQNGIPGADAATQQITAA